MRDAVGRLPPEQTMGMMTWRVTSEDWLMHVHVFPPLLDSMHHVHLWAVLVLNVSSPTWVCWVQHPHHVVVACYSPAVMSIW